MSEEEVTKNKPKLNIGIIGGSNEGKKTLRDYLLQQIEDPDLRIEVEETTDLELKKKILKLDNIIKKK